MEDLMKQFNFITLDITFVNISVFKIFARWDIAICSAIVEPWISKRFVIQTLVMVPMSSITHMHYDKP